ncbi:hypothetical protein GFM02_15320 [Rhizobium leguminosarum bv. viciae]|uniref:hypothetical protein n=1 Tax=Rhizobium leguminosarum TaxID=384 RepID=UPI00144137F8|nr:hypothetical protein [Rhizobium leguminosarum]NKK99606.1 hypothetical protein [Rhizobium leguminosarum bv. viciae]
MDASIIETALGLASTAVSVTGKAASTAEAIKKLFASDKAADAEEAIKLVNILAAELTAANLMKVNLSKALKDLSVELRIEDQFEKDKARYELFTTSQGDIVFKLRADAAGGQPEHFICPACLNKDRLIIFIQGTGDHKRCQVNQNHLYTFGNTPIRSSASENPYY